MTSTRRVNWSHLLAEAVVVVLSILLALAVDEWRSGREDRAVEREYLARLLVDLDDNLQVIDGQSRAQVSEIAAARFVYPVVSDGDWSGLDPAEVVRASYLATPSPTPTWTRGTFDELVSTGRMELIRSPELRAALLEYYRFLEGNDYTYELMSTEYRDAVRARMDPDLQLRLRSDCTGHDRSCDVPVDNPHLAEYRSWLTSNEELADGLRRVIVQWTRGETEYLPGVAGRTRRLRDMVVTQLGSRMEEGE